jgi:hypothetical protein
MQYITRLVRKKMRGQQLSGWPREYKKKLIAI